MMNIFVFEDTDRNNFLPLVYMRKVYDLKCGVMTLKEKIEAYFSKTNFHFTIFVNGRVLADDDLVSSVKACKSPCLLIQDGILIAAVMDIEKAKGIDIEKPLNAHSFDPFELDKRSIKARIVTYPWDLVHRNAKEIESDTELLRLKSPSLKTGQAIIGVNMTNKRNIFIGRNSVLKPGVLIDAEEGPVIIDDGAKVLGNAVIMGPAYIGKETVIKAGAKIYGGTTIGPFCKIGGEVEGTIFHGYSNKQHDGFIGHSYICEWVNLGADTNNSDLKNNYGNVKVHINGQMMDSGNMFVGLFMGDHSKSGINTMFNTGTVVGISSNVFGAGFPPKFIPSFSWGGAEKLVEYSAEKAVETAKIVMKRRNIEMTSKYEEQFKKLFAETAHERKGLK
jgi:UDP-N-acetylglucosamine diphosphorylase/glucosamine-1-phosphate N-acetyltransferase